MLDKIRRILQLVKKLLNPSNFGLAPIAYAYFREQGLRATIRKVVSVLGITGSEAQILNADRWHYNSREQFDLSGRGEHLFLNKSVLIVGALGLPQCKKYRVIQKIEQLTNVWGVKVKLSEYLDIHRAFTLMQTVTTVIFYRVPDGTYFDACYNEARRLGVTVGYDIDDPIFSLDIYNANSNLKTLDKAEKNNLLAETPNYLSAMKKCDYLIASTPGIFAAMQNLINKPVYLWRNCIDFETNSIAETVLAEKNEQSNKGVVRIGYMSGSRSHDEDFSLVANILARVMGEYPEVELVVGGYADIPCELMSLNHRIEIVPYSGYQGYFKNISNLDIVIVPLVKDAFNECKSAIRFMEAAIMCKPCVSSEVGDFSNIVKNGETGFLADADESWYQALSDLISSPALRLRMGLAAASDVQSHYSSKVISETLLKPLLDYIKGRGRE